MTLRPVVRSVWLPLLLLALPIAAWVAILARTVVNIPIMDDYDAILHFLSVYAGLHGFFPRLQWVLTAQHNEYKLISLHAVIAAEYQATGRLNFTFLCWLGNLFIPLTACALWPLLPAVSLGRRLWLFLPIGFLLFSLQYFDSTNWALGGLQNLTVVPFALFALIVLQSRPRALFVAGTLSLALSIACSASGFFAALAGFCILTCLRRWRRASAWLATTAVMAALYALHFQAFSVGERQSAARATLYFLVSAVSFLGSAVGRLGPSLLLAALLLTTAGYLLRRGWHRVDTRSFSIALFIGITALGVAHGRFRLGLDAGIASRYRIYSLLLITALYLGILRLFASSSRPSPATARRLLAVFTLLCGLFCALSDYAAQWRLLQRKQLLIAHLILWERQPGLLTLIPTEVLGLSIPPWIDVRQRAQRTMLETLAAHRYNPPVIAADPLPRVIRLNTPSAGPAPTQN